MTVPTASCFCQINEMTCWSDNEMLINFIRHSFIVCDETSVSEAILQSPVISAKAGGLLLSRKKSPQPNSFDDELEESTETESTSGSPDIQIDVGHRLRSNTAIRLQELKAEKITQSRTKTVVWKNPENSNDLISSQFERRPVQKCLSRGKISLLSTLIAKSPTVVENPFFDFAKWDGNFHPGSAVKNFRIFPLHADFPLNISVLSCAKIADLIGLCCYHYTADNRSPPLRHKTAQSYQLFMCEDTGEIDDDLPPLDSHETVSKFGFPVLAMVELRPKAVQLSNGPTEISHSDDTNILTVSFTDGDVYQMSLASLEVPLRLVRQEILSRRFAKLNEPQHRRLLDYTIEKLSDPGKPLSVESPVKSAGTTQFCLVRANSVRSSREESLSPAQSARHEWMANSRTSSQSFDNLDSTLVFSAWLAHKMRPSVPVNLTLSPTGLEVAPSSTVKRKHSGAARFLPPALTPSANLTQISLEKLGGCEIVERKNGGRLAFRLCHKTVDGEWKSHTYEAEESTAKEFQAGFDRLVGRRPTAVRLEFLHGTFNSAPRQSSMRKLSSFSSRLRRLQSFD